MNKPTQLDMIRHLSEHYGLQFTEVARIMKVPTHPADMRDNAAIMVLQGLVTSGKSNGFTADVQTAFAYADKFMEERTK